NHDRMRQTIAYIRQYPDEFVRTSLYRAYGFWSGSIRTVFSDDDTARFRFYVPLSILGLVGLALVLIRRRPGTVVYLWLLVLYPLVYYFTYPLTRQRHAIEPELVILASYVVVALFSWICSKAKIADLQSHAKTVARIAWAGLGVLIVVCGVVGVDRAAT